MSDFTVASTTDTQEEINRVAGVAVAEAEAEEPKEPETEEAPKAEAKDEAEEAPKPQAKSAVQKRIDKLVRRIHELEENQSKPAAVAKEPEPVTEPEVKEVPAITAEPKWDEYSA